MRRRSGQALVEFALSFTIFFMLAMTAFDFGRAVWYVSELNHAASEVSFYEFRHGDDSGAAATDAQLRAVGDATLVLVPANSVTWTFTPASPGRTHDVKFTVTASFVFSPVLTNWFGTSINLQGFSAGRIR